MKFLARRDLIAGWFLARRDGGGEIHTAVFEFDPQGWSVSHILPPPAMAFGYKSHNLSSIVHDIPADQCCILEVVKGQKPKDGEEELWGKSCNEVFPEQGLVQHLHIS